MQENQTQMDAVAEAAELKPLRTAVGVVVKSRTRPFSFKIVSDSYLLKKKD